MFDYKTQSDLPVRPVPELNTSGRPLAAWTYSNQELFELELDALFLRQWQFVCHQSELPEVGDYLTHSIGNCGIFVVRGEDGELRAFKNVCRHRASRLLDDRGVCEKRAIVCPYHGWAYNLDGQLRGIRSPQNFPGADKAKLGLHQVESELFHGLLFVRVEGDGPGVAEAFGDTGHWFEKYGVADYVVAAEASTEIWEVNWKVAYDNYLENYHIPGGHPGLHRLLIEEDGVELTSGVSFGVFAVRDTPSSVLEERRYQELLPCVDARLPEALRGKWLQYGYSPNLGIDLYPEVLDMFLLVPLGLNRTLVKTSYFGMPAPGEDEQELRRLNLMINAQVNNEDQQLCAGVQAGLRTSGYRPGPLSLEESGIHWFHEKIRTLIPVAGLDQAPHGEVLARDNGLPVTSDDPPTIAG